MDERMGMRTLTDGAPVRAADMVAALTARRLVFEDGAEQVFAPDGTTTYRDGGRATEGEWSILRDGEFSSFWPPDYRASYALRWRVVDGTPIGLVFSQSASGEEFVATFG